MPGFLKQSTASQSRALGPFLDDTDFKTPETGLTIANTDIKLVVNGGASANKNSGGGTHRVNGVYGVTFDATDTATVGEIEVSVVVAGALPVFDKFVVIEEAVYDAFYAASATGVSAGIALEATSQSILLDTAEIGVAGAGLTNINLPDQVMNITGNITGNLTGSVGNVTGSVGSVTGLTASDVAAIKVTTDKFVFTTPNQVDARVLTNSDKTDYGLSATGSAAFTEGYRANGAAGTLPQLLYEISQHLGESSISSTTKTIKKLDHTTAAETFTLNSATTPTSITRAT